MNQSVVILRMTPSFSRCVRPVPVRQCAPDSVVSDTVPWVAFYCAVGGVFRDSYCYLVGSGVMLNGLPPGNA